MAFPYLDNPATLPASVVQELDALVAKLNSYLRQQHVANGGHGAITASSVTVEEAGAVTVEDEHGNPSSFVRNLALGTRIDIESTTADTTPYLSVRYRDALNVPLEAIVKLGIVGSGSAGQGRGIAMYGEAPRSDWAMISGSVTAGFAWLLLDTTHDERVLLAVDTSGHYEVRPESFGQEVWLGTNGTAEKRFTRGYIDHVFTTDLYEHGRIRASGEWDDVAFSAAHFTTDGGAATWDVTGGEVSVQRFTLMGQTMHYNVNIIGSNVSTATPAYLSVALPAGYTVAATFIVPVMCEDAGSGNLMGFCFGNPTDTAVHVIKLDNSAWTITAGNNTSVYLHIAFEVVG